jgi:hypothetical protein
MNSDVFKHTEMYYMNSGVFKHTEMYFMNSDVFKHTGMYFMNLLKETFNILLVTCSDWERCFCNGPMAPLFKLQWAIRQSQWVKNLHQTN